MQTCAYEKYFSEYVSGELTASLEIEFVKHLQTCDICKANLDKYYALQIELRGRERPAPHPEILREYHQELRKIIPQIRSGLHFFSVIDYFARPRSPWIRLAEVFTVLMVGLLGGWLLFGETDAVADNQPAEPFYHLSKPVSGKQLEYINYYLLASEMILLEVENTETEDFFLSRENAQKLLIKTFVVHETALQINDPQLLRFLTKMEFILHEIANTDDDDVGIALQAIKSVVNDTDLIQEVKRLQTELKSTLAG